MIVRAVSDADARAEWDRVRDRGDPFGNLAYADALAETGVELVVAADGGRSAALLATGSLGPFRRAFVPPLTPYTPLSMDPGDGEAASHAGVSSLQVLADSLADTFDDVLVLLPPRIADVRPMQWSGWTVEPRYTYRIDPGRAADPATWSDNPRRTLAQHRSAFNIVEDSRYAVDAARLCAASYERHDRSGPMDAKRMGILAKRLADEGLVRVTAALDDSGKVAAGLAMIRGASACYYWMAGSEPGPAMTVLLASVFERLAAESVPILDLVGANTPSIAEFKRRFGPELVGYYLARKTSNRVLRFLAGVRSALRS